MQSIERAFSGDGIGDDGQFREWVNRFSCQAIWGVLRGFCWPQEWQHDAFSSSCHGAGRKIVKNSCEKTIDSLELLIKRLEEQGIQVRSENKIYSL